MKVKVLYFASARDLAEVGSESLQIQDGSSVDDLSAEIGRVHPAFRKMAGSVRFSVNLELAGRKATLRDKDEVGVLPPVAGG